jgi:hypothetical protein
MALPKRRMLLTILGSVLLIGGIRLYFYPNAEYKRLVEACKQLRIDLTEQEVHKIMGLPVRTTTVDLNGVRLKTLTYLAPSIVASPIDVIIDAATGRVQKVTCDDDYNLVRPEGR